MKAFKELLQAEDKDTLVRIIKQYCGIGMCNYATIAHDVQGGDQGQGHVLELVRDMLKKIVSWFIGEGRPPKPKLKLESAYDVGT